MLSASCAASVNKNIRITKLSQLALIPPFLYEPSEDLPSCFPLAIAAARPCAPNPPLWKIFSGKREAVQKFWVTQLHDLWRKPKSVGSPQKCFSVSNFPLTLALARYSQTGIFMISVQVIPVELPTLLYSTFIFVISQTIKDVDTQGLVFIAWCRFSICDATDQLRPISYYLYKG